MTVGVIIYLSIRDLIYVICIPLKPKTDTTADTRNGVRAEMTKVT